METSAVVSIILEEADGPSLAREILASPTAIISAASGLEAKIVIGGRKGNEALAGQVVERFLQEFNVAVIPFDIEQARLAFQAFLAYGKGRHPAGLNFGDCFAYGLAKSRSAQLLYKGNDFALTDLA